MNKKATGAPSARRACFLLKIVGILHGFFAVLRGARVTAVFVVRRPHSPLTPFATLHYSFDLELAFAPFAVLLEQHLPPEVLLEAVCLLDGEEVEVCLLFFI